MKSFIKEDSLNYIWNKTHTVEVFFESNKHIYDQFCVFQFYSNKENVRKDGLFIGDVEMNVVYLLSGPYKHKCDVLHGDNIGYFTFSCKAVQILNPIIELQSLEIKNLPPTEFIIIPKIYVIQKNQFSKRLDKLPTHTENFNYKLSHPIKLSTIIDTNHYWGFGCFIQISMFVKGNLLKQKTEIAKVTFNLKEIYKLHNNEYKFNMEMEGCDIWKDKMFLLSCKFLIEDLPTFRQSEVGLHRYTGNSSEFIECNTFFNVINPEEQNLYFSDCQSSSRPLERSLSLDFHINVNQFRISGLLLESCKFVISTNITDKWNILFSKDLKRSNLVFEESDIILPVLSTLKPYNLTRRFISFELYDGNKKIFDAWISLHDFMCSCPYFELTDETKEYNSIFMQFFRCINCSTMNFIEITKIESTFSDNKEYSYKYQIEDRVYRNNFNQNEAIKPFPILYQTNNYSIYYNHFIMQIIDPSSSIIGTIPIYLRDFFPISEVVTSKLYKGVLDNETTFEIDVYLHQYKSTTSSNYYDYQSYSEGINRNRIIYLPETYTINNKSIKLIQQPNCKIIRKAPQLIEQIKTIEEKKLFYFEMTVKSCNITIPENIILEVYESFIYIKSAANQGLLKQLFFTTLNIKVSSHIFQIITPTFQLTGIVLDANYFKVKIDSIIDQYKGFRDFEILDNFDF